jgi:hypothetical protein
MRRAEPTLAVELLIWIVSLDRVPGKLSWGGKVAAVGGGLGPATILVARAYPRSRFLSFATCPGEVAQARRLAETEGVADRVTFQLGRPADFAGMGYDVVAHVEGPRDGPEAESAARHVRRTLAPDGTWMIVAPDAVESRLRAAVLTGGFTRFRRAGELPFVFEVRA